MTPRARPAAGPDGARRVKGDRLSLLQLLAGRGASHSLVIVTSAELGTSLGISQQSADRHLVQLERDGLLERTIAQRRQRVRLTSTGLSVLRREYHAYRRIFEGPARIRFDGQVASGLGEGRYYLSQPGYVLQFTERLGYTPYPGTLNVRLRPEEFLRVGSVSDWSGIRIDGFEASGRTFGGATCYAARLSGRPCHLIVPDRTHHKDVIEFIAPERLRDSLNVVDGDEVRVEVEES